MAMRVRIHLFIWALCVASLSLLPPTYVAANEGMSKHLEFLSENGRWEQILALTEGNFDPEVTLYRERALKELPNLYRYIRVRNAVKRSDFGTALMVAKLVERDSVYKDRTDWYVSIAKKRFGPEERQRARRMAADAPDVSQIQLSLIASIEGNAPPPPVIELPPDRLFTAEPVKVELSVPAEEVEEPPLVAALDIPSPRRVVPADSPPAPLLTIKEHQALLKTSPAKTEDTSEDDGGYHFELNEVLEDQNEVSSTSDEVQLWRDVERAWDSSALATENPGFSDAEKHLISGLFVDPDDALLWLHLAELQEGAGAYRFARELYEHARRLDGEGPVGETATQRLRRLDALQGG